MTFDGSPVQVGSVRIEECDTFRVPPRYPWHQLLDQFVRVPNLNADLAIRIVGFQATKKRCASGVRIKEVVLGEGVFESKGSVRGAFDELLFGSNELVVQKMKVLVISASPSIADS